MAELNVLDMQLNINRWYSSNAARYDNRMNSTHEVHGARTDLFRLLNIMQGAKVIEIGVGTGKNLKYYQRKGVDVVGVDVNPEMLAMAKESAGKLGLTNVAFLLGNSRALSFCKSLFDIGVMTYALSAIPCNEHALSELERVVKPGV